MFIGHVCIIVNVASQCGLTENNYKSLNELYEQFAERKGQLNKMYITKVPCRSVHHRDRSVVGVIASRNIRHT